MPDISTNTVLVLGQTREGIDRFIEAVRGPAWDGSFEQVFTFHKIKPVPEGSSFYETWGTKWDANFGEMNPTGSFTRYSGRGNSFHAVRYTFETAWNAPFGLFKNLRSMFPELLIIWSARSELEDTIWLSDTNDVAETPTLLQWDSIFAQFATPTEDGGMEPANDPAPLTTTSNRLFCDNSSEPMKQAA